MGKKNLLTTKISIIAKENDYADIISGIIDDFVNKANNGEEYNDYDIRKAIQDKWLLTYHGNSKYSDDVFEDKTKRSIMEYIGRHITIDITKVLIEFVKKEVNRRTSKVPSYFDIDIECKTDKEYVDVVFDILMNDFLEEFEKCGIKVKIEEYTDKQRGMFKDIRTIRITDLNNPTGWYIDAMDIIDRVRGGWKECLVKDTSGKEHKLCVHVYFNEIPMIF